MSSVNYQVVVDGKVYRPTPPKPGSRPSPHPLLQKYYKELSELEEYLARYRQLRSEVEELREKIESRSSGVEELKKELEEKLSLLNQLAGRIENLRAVIEQRRKQLAEASQRAQALAAKIEAFNERAERLAKLYEILRDYEITPQEQQELLRMGYSYVRDINYLIKQYNMELELLKKELPQVQEYQRELGIILQGFEELRTRFEESVELYNKLVEEYGKIRQTALSLSEQLKARGQELTSLLSQFKTKYGQLKALAETVAKEYEDVKNVLKEIEEYKRLTRKEAQIAGIDLEIAQAVEKSRELATWEGVYKRYASLEQELKTLREIHAWEGIFKRYVSLEQELKAKQEIAVWQGTFKRYAGLEQELKTLREVNAWEGTYKRYLALEQELRTLREIAVWEPTYKRYVALEEKEKQKEAEKIRKAVLEASEKIEEIEGEPWIRRVAEEKVRELEEILYAPSKLLSEKIEEAKNLTREASSPAQKVVYAVGASALAFVKGVYDSLVSVLAPWRIVEMFNPQTYKDMYKRLTTDPLAYSELAGSITGGFILGKALGKAVGYLRSRYQNIAYELAPDEAHVLEVQLLQHTKGLRLRAVVKETGKAVEAGTVPDEIAYVAKTGEIETAHTLMQYMVGSGELRADYLSPIRRITRMVGREGESFVLEGVSRRGYVMLRQIASKDIRGFIGEHVAVKGSKYTSYRFIDVDIFNPEALGLGRIARTSISLGRQLASEGGLQQLLQLVTREGGVRTITVTRMAPAPPTPTIPIPMLPKLEKMLEDMSRRVEAVQVEKQEEEGEGRAVAKQSQGEVTLLLTPSPLSLQRQLKQLVAKYSNSIRLRIGKPKAFASLSSISAPSPGSRTLSIPSLGETVQEVKETLKTLSMPKAPRITITMPKPVTLTLRTFGAETLVSKNYGPAKNVLEELSIRLSPLTPPKLGFIEAPKLVEETRLVEKAAPKQKEGLPPIESVLESPSVKGEEVVAPGLEEVPGLTAKRFQAQLQLPSIPPLAYLPPRLTLRLPPHPGGKRRGRRRKRRRGLAYWEREWFIRDILPIKKNRRRGRR